MEINKLESKLRGISENTKEVVSKVVVYGGNYLTNFLTSGTIGNAYDAIGFGLFDAINRGKNTKLNRLIKSGGYVYYIGSCAFDLYSALKGDPQTNFGQFACDLGMALQLGNNSKRLYTEMAEEKTEGPKKYTIRDDFKSMKENIKDWRKERKARRKIKKARKKAIKERAENIAKIRKERIAKEEENKTEIANPRRLLPVSRKAEKNAMIYKNKILDELKYAYNLDTFSPELDNEGDVKGYYTAAVLNTSTGVGIGSFFGDGGAMVGGAVGLGYTLLASILGKKKAQDKKSEDENFGNFSE